MPFLRIFICFILIGLISCDESTDKSPTSKNDLPVNEDIENCPSSSGSNAAHWCARVIHDGPFIAGEMTTFSIEVTVGKGGIAKNGGIAIGTHHAAGWRFQTLRRNGANHVGVDDTHTRNITLNHYMGVIPPNIYATGSNRNRIFNKLLTSKLEKKKLAAGDRVTFIFGDNRKGIRTPQHTDEDQEFRISIDSDGDGIFEKTLKTINFQIKHAKGKELAAIAPSQVQKDQPFHFHLRLEDEFLNVTESFKGSVSLYDENNSLLAENVAFNRGMAQTNVVLTSIGHHRIRIRSTDGQYKGRSNPIRVFESLPEKRLYWGDLHGHTSVSDGLGKDANEYFQFGRDVAALDFIALTDHGNEDWPANIKAVQDFYEPGKYVTLLAQEISPGPDHLNLYFRSDNTPHFSESWEYKPYTEIIRSMNREFNEHAEQPEALTGPHHFAYNRGFYDDKNYPFEFWDERIVRFIEVYSSHGTSEFPGNPRPLGRAHKDFNKYMQGALAKGLKFGVIAASDNHDSKPGRSTWFKYPGGLAGVWATELTRDAIWDSLWNYQVYGTSKDRIYMDFSINNESVGTTFMTKTPPYVQAYIIGKTDTLEVAIIRDNKEIKVFKTTNGLIEFDFYDGAKRGNHFYYLRVTQDNEERAWSTPIWVTVE